jgi:HD-like signal output (HDOD) protein
MGVQRSTASSQIDAILAALPQDPGLVAKLVRARMAETDDRWG